MLCIQTLFRLLVIYLGVNRDLSGIIYISARRDAGMRELIAAASIQSLIGLPELFISILAPGSELSWEYDTGLTN